MYRKNQYDQKKVRLHSIYFSVINAHYEVEAIINVIGVPQVSSYFSSSVIQKISHQKMETQERRLIYDVFIRYEDKW